MKNHQIEKYLDCKEAWSGITIPQDCVCMPPNWKKQTRECFSYSAPNPRISPTNATNKQSLNNDQDLNLGMETLSGFPKKCVKA